jgi:alkylation response protein AidB-like acyl-CoA dehydrogenase
VGYVLQRRAFGVLIGSFQTVQHRLADHATAVDGARLLAYKAAWDALDILGAEGMLAADAVGAPLAGKLEQGFRAAVVTTVYGGASEILREIIAERRLGLPRNRPGG